MIHYNQGPQLKLKGRRTMCGSPENHGLISLIILSTCLNGFCLLFKMHWVIFSKSERYNIFILAIIFYFLPAKVYLVKAMVFPVVMYACECWTIKKVENKELMLLNCGVGEDS